MIERGEKDMGKIYDGIMGLVVGDAVGVPYEFKGRDSFKAKTITGYGTYNQPVGTWSDDSSMTLATVESLASLGRISLDHIMRNFYNWLNFGDFTPYGKVFDVGNTTKAAIYRYENGTSPIECGGTSIMDNGNGSLMRILPLAFVDCSDYDIYKVSALTHGHFISQFACFLYIRIAKSLLSGWEIPDAIEEAMTHIPGHLSGVFERFTMIGSYSRDKIKSTGYVLDSLEAALWCLLKTYNYKECILTAVNLGGDTDTIAAIAGGLAGIYYGVSDYRGIPQEWIDQIARKDYIKDLCKAFENKFSPNGVRS